jgi:ribonuclease D
VAVIDVFRTGVEVLRQLQGASVIAHNAAFELSFFETHVARDLFGDVHDTLQAARLTLGADRTSLAKAAKAYLELDLDKDKQTSDWAAEHLSKEQLDYAALDAVVLWKLSRRVLPALQHQRSAYDIQMEAIPAAVRMELRGFLMDEALHTQLVKELQHEQAKASLDYSEAATAAGLPDKLLQVHQRQRKRCLRRC